METSHELYTSYLEEFTELQRREEQPITVLSLSLDHNEVTGGYAYGNSSDGVCCRSVRRKSDQFGRAELV